MSENISIKRGLKFAASLNMGKNLHNLLHKLYQYTKGEVLSVTFVNDTV